MLLTCCTQTSFMILVAEQRCRKQRPLQTCLLECASPVCVPAWAPWTCWCSQTDISYHHLMLPQQWSPPETSGTDCPSVCPRRNGWRCCSLERRTKMKVSLCSGFNPIFADVRLSVFSCLARTQNKPVELLPEALQPHSCQHPPKIK